VGLSMGADVVSRLSEEDMSGAAPASEGKMPAIEAPTDARLPVVAMQPTNTTSSMPVCWVLVQVSKMDPSYSGVNTAIGAALLVLDT